MSEIVGRSRQYVSVDTYLRSPHALFALSQNFNIPLFQRRYVWTEEDQWAPLWSDVRRTAEARAGGNADVTHFLGAVVLQDQGAVVGGVPQWSVIDGQQRITSLQLLMDAAAAALEELEQTRLASRLRKLTHNDADEVDGDLLKLRHSNADREAFDEVMEAPAPVDHSRLKSGNTLVAAAHAFFTERIAHWLQEKPDEDQAQWASALADTLASALQLVVIALKPDEDSQEIFETLNARGTPLQAADLIKNLLFQRLVSSVMSPEVAYREYWRLFETPFWEKEVTVGRVRTTRSALFLNQWLVSRVGEDVGPRAFFRRFKHFVDHEFDGDAAEILKLLHGQAITYQRWVERAASQDPSIDRVSLSVYRMDAIGLQIARPMLIWLHQPGFDVPENELSIAIDAVESWLVRRAILRLSASDLGRIVARLINQFRDTTPDGIGTRIRNELARLSTETTYWPDDDEIRDFLATAPVYSHYSAARMRMLLEAVEDDARGFNSGKSKTGVRTSRGIMAIEHVLPRRWQTNWPVATLAEEVERTNHVHRLGNLTLLTHTLNSSVSNAAWGSDSGKRAALRRHDVMLMTRNLTDRATWDEAAIDGRTEEMTAAILATWPIPEEHSGLPEAKKPMSTYVSVKDLVASGRLLPGTVLKARTGGEDAEITDRGDIRYKGRLYDTPSGAGKAALGRTVNGWHFWRLEDGRRLVDVRMDQARADDVRASTRERGLREVTEWLQARGWAVNQEKTGNRLRLVAERDGKQRSLRVSTKSAASWQLSTADGTPAVDSSGYWAFVDLQSAEPTVVVYSEQNIRDLIAVDVAEYLGQHGGKRPVNSNSEHFALHPSRLASINPRLDW